MLICERCKKSDKVADVWYYDMAFRKIEAGGNTDLTVLDVNLCDECLNVVLKDVRDLLKEVLKYGTKN